MTEIQEKIPQHRHCVNCGKAFIGPGQFCSDQCKDTAGDEVKGKLKKLAGIWIAIVVATVVLVLLIR
jgi:predicted nucleic acid-binding Zn ribbon protein